MAKTASALDVQKDVFRQLKKNMVMSVEQLVDKLGKKYTEEQITDALDALKEKGHAVNAAGGSNYMITKASSKLNPNQLT